MRRGGIFIKFLFAEREFIVRSTHKCKECNGPEYFEFKFILLHFYALLMRKAIIWGGKAGADDDKL